METLHFISKYKKEAPLLIEELKFFYDIHKEVYDSGLTDKSYSQEEYELCMNEINYIQSYMAMYERFSDNSKLSNQLINFYKERV